uniref:ATP synthase F0 subunit 8 n=1 Tax=Eclysippe vanelli TaxID=479700 RepID=B3TJY5_ECLVA|nr:ATP synthase F0 subunit 8 [Eclysippe vanelli]
MPHLSPIMWFVTVVMFLVVLFMLISSVWWLQMPSFELNMNKSGLKENFWCW